MTTACITGIRDAGRDYIEGQPPHKETSGLTADAAGKAGTMGNWQKRIHDVVGDDDARCSRNAERWRTHLLSRLPLPIRVTGIEDFPWEEPYIFGARDQNEYARMKKTRPSYTDTFDLIGIEGPEDNDDLVARVRRIADRKVFQIGLSWLRTEDKNDFLYNTLNDYSIWHANY